MDRVQQRRTRGQLDFGVADIRCVGGHQRDAGQTADLTAARSQPTPPAVGSLAIVIRGAPGFENKRLVRITRTTTDRIRVDADSDAES